MNGWIEVQAGNKLSKMLDFFQIFRPRDDLF